MFTIMPFQPDLTRFKPLAPDAPFPSRMQGAWVDAENGMPAMTIEGRRLTLETQMPVHELFVLEENGYMAVLNTLVDTSHLVPDWAEQTVFMFNLDESGALSIAGFCDYWTLVQADRIDPRKLTSPPSPYQPLAPDDLFPDLLQGHWHGAWLGQEVIIGPREVTIDGEQVDFLAAKLIQIIPSNDAPLCSLVLDLDKDQVALRFGAETMPMLNFAVFRSGDMQGAGAGLRDTIFSPSKD